MELGSRGSEVVFNIVTVLTGKAWDLVEDLSLDQLSSEGAMDEVLARLDRGFKYDPLTELPDDFEQYFNRLQRKTGQTLQDYVNEYTRTERRLEITQLPEKIKAWWFLRKSGVTKEQRQLVLTNVGTDGLTVEKIQKAMTFIRGQDSRPEGASRWKKSDAFFLDEEIDWADEDWDDASPIFWW
ncbi:Copia protein [Durusdinium trenchii]|uniref:Copia protein n=1 Tax=Durusdinium trenchii TaxID=1381693 RepID=A0ABP0QKH5_9DINO